MSEHFLYFKAENMTCAACEGSLESMVEANDCVEKASASHLQGVLKVKLKKDISKRARDDFIKTMLQDVSDIYPLELTENPFAALKEQPPKPYFKRAMINSILALAWHGLEGTLIATLSLGAGLGLHALVLMIMLWSGSDFYLDAVKKLKNKTGSMNTLVSLSTLIAWGYSLLNLLIPSYFMGALYAFMPIFMILGLTNLGRSIRQRAEQKAFKLTQDFDSLFERYQPTKALRLEHEKAIIGEEIDVMAIKMGDVLEVQEGEPFPTDGILLSEHAWVNQKVLKGESLAVKKTRNDTIFGGTINTQGVVKIWATTKEQDNALMRLLSRVRAAQLGRSESMAWVDAISQKFVPIVFGVSFLSASTWFVLTGSTLLAFNSMISVLLCACPCALGLAAPITHALGLYKLLHQGVLVKNADSLQILSEVDTFVFDKTGTLTEPRLQDSFFIDSFKRQGPIMVASLESHFAEQHPLARACMALSQEVLLKVEDAKRHESGQGVEGRLEHGDKLWVGNSSLLDKLKIRIPKTFRDKAGVYRSSGYTPIFVAHMHQVIGILGFEHLLKPNTAQALSDLKRRGYRLAVMTGDHEETTQKSLKNLPFDEIHSELKAEDKSVEIQKLKAQGYKIAYVGDGPNDLEGAQASDVGISIEAWTYLASKAEISLKSDLGAIPHAIEVARMIQVNIKQNLAWTFFYNCISIVVASGALTPWFGVALNPVLFTGSMALSSLVVIANSLRIPSIISHYYSKIPGQASLQVQPWDSPKVAPTMREPMRPEPTSKPSCCAEPCPCAQTSEQKKKPEIRFSLNRL